MVPSSRGRGRSPLKAKTRVRIPLGPLEITIEKNWTCNSLIIKPQGVGKTHCYNLMPYTILKGHQTVFFNLFNSTSNLSEQQI